MTTVGDIMSPNLVTVTSDASVAEAATIMGGQHVGSAIVLDSGVPVGIFTDRDALRALASDFDAAHHPVTQWMSRDPTTVGPETEVRAARELMLERGFRHLPVAEGGRIVGVISIRDLSRVER
jgi:CBS domain-containing protein